MNTLRIAIVTYSYPVEVGGGGLYATLLAQGLAALGEDVHIFASRNLGNDSEPNAGSLDFHHVPSVSWPFITMASYRTFLLQRIRRVVSRMGSFDVIHCMGTLGLRLPRHDKSWKLGVCSMFHLSQVTKEEVQPRLINRIRWLGGEIGLMPIYERRCIDRADCVLTLSEHTKKEITHRYNKPSHLIGVIPLAVSPEILRLSRIPPEELGQYPRLHQGCNILFVGRVYYRKRIDFLLESFKEVLRNQDATLWIVGPGNLDFYRKRARKLGIEKKVVFTGTIDRPALVRLYKLCDVFAFPSASEGFGFVLVEAMINGLPIVGVNSTSIPEIADGCGIMVEPSDLKGFSQAISSLLVNKKMRQSLGEAGRRKVARDYSDWDLVSRRTRDFYLEQKDLIAR